MFNFNRNNNTTATSTAGTSSAGNSFLSSSSWNTNNNSSSTSTGGFSFANNNNNQTNSTLGFPSTSSFATNNNTAGLGSGAGFTFNSTNNNNNATNNNMFSTGNTGNNSMLGSNNNTMFKFNTATTTTNNNNTLPSSSFASNNNPFATNSSSSTSTFPAFSSSFNNNTMTTMNNSKPSFPSFVPTPFTASSGEKIKYYSLNKMEHYKDKSFEECRYDYWYAQKNGTLPATTSSATSNNTNNWMNSGSSLTSNSNSAWSMPSAISTGTTNPTTATNNSTFNFGLNSTSNTAATNNTTGNTLGSTNWLSNNNNNNGGSMFNTQPTNLFNTNNNNTTNTTNNGMFPSTNGTSNMFNTNPTTAPSTSTFNFSNGNTNNTLPTNNSSTFSFPSIGNNTAQPSMFNLGGSSNPTTANNSTYNFGLNPANSTTTASNVNQPFSWNTSANNNNLTSTNPTTNGTSSFLSTSLPSFQPSTIGNNMFTNTNPTTIGNTSAFNFTNTANSNGMMTTANIPINSDATLLSVLNQPYGENSLYEEKYQPLAFMTKVESEEESTQDDKSSKELSASFCARPRLGKFKKPTLAEKLTLINNQAQMEEKQQTQENLFDDLAFRHKNSLKELTIFPNNAFNKNEKSIYPTIEENVIETHEERISSNTTIVKTSIHQGRASPPTNVDLVKPKAVKGMIFQSEEFHKKKDERVTVPKFLPKLTKEGYYTIPSMKELSMMGNADLKNCRNFTIGRHGYGEIQVLGYLDLTRGLDLDRIVCEIEKHHVDLYSNHSPNEKPQVGSELNRPCIITLFNVHPTTQNKSQPTTFEKMTQFQAKLKKANQKSGSEFINYSNGEWIFKVNHF